MTQNKGYIPASRRPGVLVVHSIDHFSLTVPDLEEARHFYTNFGLDVREKQGSLELNTVGHAHRWGKLFEGPQKRLHYLSFGAFEDDFPRFRERLQQLGVKRLDPPRDLKPMAFGFGTVMEFLSRSASPKKLLPTKKRRLVRPHRRPACAPRRSARTRPGFIPPGSRMFLSIAPT